MTKERQKTECDDSNPQHTWNSLEERRNDVENKTPTTTGTELEKEMVLAHASLLYTLMS